MKTIEEWLMQLKGKAGAKAMNVRITSPLLRTNAQTLATALSRGFSWADTSEGYEYWSRWYYALLKDPNAVWHPDEEYDAVTVNRYWEYDVKCRKCGKITRMYHSTHEQVSKENFTIWAKEHSTFPVEKQCSCDNGMMMLHDIVSYGNVLFL